MAKHLHYIWLTLITAVLLTGCAASSNGQGNVSKKAEKYYREAKEHLNWDRFSEAETALLNAIDKSPNFVQAYIQLSLVYKKTEQYEKAFNTLRNITVIQEDPNKELYFQLAQMGFASQHYDEAMSSLNQYINKGPHKEARELEVQQLKQNLEFAAEAIANPVPFKPQPVSQNINTGDNEYFPQVSADGMSLIFVQQSPMVQGPGTQEDILVAQLGVAGWAQIRTFSSNINTPFGNEGAPCLSVNGRTLYMTFCAMRENGGCDIFVSHKKGNIWSRPAPVKGAINSSAWEGQPWLSADERTLYFSSNREGGLGGKDIWKSTKQADGSWGDPVNLGPTINTPYNEEKPFIHPDRKTLYFSSTGHPGFGQEDFFISRKESGKWSKPKNLGYPVNTYGRELGLFVDLPGKKAYYATNGGVANNSQDIYVFDLYDEVKPTTTTYVKGIVKDKRTGKRMPATVEVYDLYTQQLIGTFSTDEEMGDFLVSLPTGKEYAFYAFKKDYMFLSKYFYLAGDYEKTDLPIFEVLLKMEKIDQGSKIVLNNLFFDSGSSKLKPSSVAELNILVSFLKENDNLKVEIGGHTDDIGTEEDNQILSKARAKAVFDYLLSHDIDYVRLSYKGYGESEPIEANSSKEGRAINRRTELKVIGF